MLVQCTLYVVCRTGELGFAGREPKIVEPTRTFVLPISICSQPQTLGRPFVSDGEMSRRVDRCPTADSVRAASLSVAAAPDDARHGYLMDWGRRAEPSHSERTERIRVHPQERHWSSSGSRRWGKGVGVL